MKRLVLLSLLIFPIFLFAQYPTFSNKQKLGVQTTGDGLIFRGTTVGNIPNYTPSNVNNAYFHLDTINNKLYLYNINSWQQVYPAPQFDTTTLNVYLKISDTTAMLLPYFRDSDTTQLKLISRFALKLNISDTSVMLSPYLRKADTISLSNRINLKLNISDTTILSNRITTNANNIIVINNKLNTKLDTIYKKLKNVVTRVLNKDTLDLGGSLTEGYGINIIGDSINVDTIIIFTQSDTITLSNRIDLKLNKSDTASLSNRIDLKLNKTDTINLSNRIDLKLNKSDTVSLSNRINTKLNTSDTISLSNRINTKLDTLYVNYQTNVDLLSNKDTINITTLEAGAGINIVNNVISLDTVLLDSVVRVQNVYVKNGTGTVLNKGEAVYVTGANGTNIIVGRASNVAESTSSKTLGLTMTSIGVNGFGYVIKEGLLAGLNTNSATEGDPIWLGVNGGLIFGLANKPYAPNHLVYLGVVTRKQTNNGEVYVTVQNGFEIKELHDVQIINPVNKASLYYNSSESLWRDTTATLLVSDTASMLNPYLRKLDTISLSNRIDLRVKYADTTNMLLPYFRKNDTTLLNLNSRLSIKLNLSDTASMLSKYVNTYSNQTEINGDKTFNNVITIDSATVTGKLLVNTNISDAVKINSNTNSTNLELMNSGGSVYIKSSNKNMTLQTGDTALVYLKGDVNKVGILTMNPQQALEVAGTIRVDSLGNNLIPTKLVGGSNSNDLTNVALGTGLSFVNDTLKIADNIINSGDTATLLRKDYLGITSNVLVWTEGNKKLLPYFTQVYRNGQLLKYENQYTITSDSILTLAVGSFRLKDNITIIAIDNIIALAGSGGVISLSGHVSGSGTSNINTTINNGVVTNTMLAGGISNDKLDVISTAGKINNSATTATNSNTVNAIVSRNASGDFSARNITATSFLGNATTASTATIANSVQSYSTTSIIRLATPSNSLSPTITVPDASSTMAITNASQTFSGTQTFSNQIIGSISGSASSVTSTLTISAPLTGTSYNGSSSTSIGISAATTLAAGSMSAADKTKLDGIAAGATANNGTVTSVSGTGTVSGLTLTGTVTSTGNLTLGGTLAVTSSNFASQTANTILAAPSGVAGVPTFRTLVSADIPTLNQNTTGTAATITGVYGGTITSSQVTTGLGFTPYNATNPNSYINRTGLSFVAGSGAYDNTTGVITIPTNNNQITNGAGYITSSSLSSYLPLTGGILSGNLRLSSSVGTQLNIDASDNNLESRITFSTGGSARSKIYTTSSVSSMTFESIAQASAKRGFRFISSTETNQYLGLVQDPQGNVGIKSDATGDNLHPNTLYVNGTLGVTGVTTLSNLASGTTQMVTASSTGLLSTQAIPTGNISGTGTLNYLTRFTGTNTIESSSLINTSSSLFVNPETQSSFGWSFMTNTSNPFIGNNVKNGSANESLQRQSSTSLFFPSAIIFGYQRVNNSTGAVSTGGINFMTTDANIEGNINPITYSRMFITINGNIGIGTMQPSYKLDINGSLGVTGATTLSTTSATPTSLLGKDGSNVVGTVTSVNQTGIIGRGSTTNQTTNSSGEITIAHGLGWTPIMAFANLPASTTNIVNVKSVDATNIVFIIRDAATGNPLNSGSVSKVEWLAIK